MIRYKWFVLVAMIILFVGCAVSEDNRLADLGYQELTKGNYEQAEKYLNEALGIYRFNPYALLNLGVVYQNTGRLEKAREAYNNVISLQPTEKAALSNLESSSGKSLVEIASENLNMLK